MDLFFNAKMSLTSKIATGLFESFIFYFGIIHQDDLQTNDLSFHIPHAIFAHGMLGTTTTQPPFSKPSSDPTLFFSQSMAVVVSVGHYYLFEKYLNAKDEVQSPAKKE